MKLFKETTVTLHPSEKIGMFTCSLAVGILMLLSGYVAIKTTLHGFMEAVGEIGLMFVGTYMPILTYKTLNGKGINKSKED